jgi:hypothetical protein
MFTPRSFGKVGVEAYAAYALHAWLSGEPSVSGRTRRFAKWSAMCSFALGMAGQVAYHLLAQAGAARAPWPVTTIVSCLPVLVLAMGTALAHMLRADTGTAAHAADSGTAGPATSRSSAWSAEDQAGPARNQFAGPAPLTAPGPRARTGAVPQPDHSAAAQRAPIAPEIDQARLIAGRLAAAGESGVPTKRGELASNRREEQELGMLCLHILQSSLGLINTLMIQDTLALPEWAGVLTDADRRGLTPVFHTNMTPYGEIQLRTDRRLDLTDIPRPRPDPDVGRLAGPSLAAFRMQCGSGQLSRLIAIACTWRHQSYRHPNSAYRPVMDAIDLLARYAGTDSDQKLYAAGEKVPIDGVVPKAWLDGVIDDDGRVERLRVGVGHLVVSGSVIWLSAGKGGPVGSWPLEVTGHWFGNIGRPASAAGVSEALTGGDDAWILRSGPTKVRYRAITEG